MDGNIDNGLQVVWLFVWGQSVGRSKNVYEWIINLSVVAVSRSIVVDRV